MNYRIRLIETEEGWSVSCLDLPGCHSQGINRQDAVRNISDAITEWLAVEAEESGIKSCETTEITV
jgi:predicted RNase H-like HicB family nuclease